jgi:hypothetical protein
MGDTGRISPPDLGNGFHEYDRVLRLNLALRRVHGPLDSDAARPATGIAFAALQDENQRMRAALEQRGGDVPRVTEGAVQPSTLVEHPRRQIPVDDPGVCPLCGDVRQRSVCRCGYSWKKRLRKGGAAPGRDPRWDRTVAWFFGSLGALVGLFWLLQPFFR